MREWPEPPLTKGGNPPEPVLTPIVTVILTVPPLVSKGGDRLLNAVAVCCDSHISGALLADGTLLTWGDNGHGQLGLGKESVVKCPSLVKLPMATKQFSLGSFFLSFRLPP